MTTAPPGGPEAAPSEDPPQTGVPEIDEATAALPDLADAPVTAHHDRLARVHAALDDALHADQSG